MKVQQDSFGNNISQSFPTETPKSKSSLKIVLIILVVVILVTIISVGFQLFNGIKDGPRVQQTVTTFLQHVSDNNLSSAYALTSSGLKAETSLEDFRLVVSFFEPQYSGFQAQEQLGFSVEAEAGNPTLYQYSGEVTYDDGDKGDLQAILIKEDGEYKIHYISIDIGFRRLEKFKQDGSKSVLGVSSD